jgi:hypothetical protein
VGQRGKAATLSIGEAEPTAAELGLQDAIFCEQIHDDLLLVTLQPTSNHGDQDVEDHSRSRDWRPCPYPVAQSIPTLSNFKNVETAEIFNQTRCACGAHVPDRF